MYLLCPPLVSMHGYEEALPLNDLVILTRREVSMVGQQS